MCDISDVHDDIKEHLEVVGSSLTRRIRGRGSYKSWSNVSEKTSLLPDSATPSTKNGASFSSSSECLDVTPDTPPDSLNNMNV